MSSREAEIYGQRVANLRESLNDPGIRSEASDVVWSLIDTVVQSPDEQAADGRSAEQQGEFAAFRSMAEDVKCGCNSLAGHNA